MAELPHEMIKRIRHSGFVTGVESLRENLFNIGKIKDNNLVIRIADITQLVEKLEKEK